MPITQMASIPVGFGMQNLKNCMIPTSQAVATGGERYKDLRVRLKMAGFPDQAVYEDLTQSVTAIKSLPTDKVYIAATYTAMLQLREQLGAAGYIKGGF